MGTMEVIRDDLKARGEHLKSAGRKLVNRVTLKDGEPVIAASDTIVGDYVREKHDTTKRTISALGSKPGGVMDRLRKLRRE